MSGAGWTRSSSWRGAALGDTNTNRRRAAAGSAVPLAVSVVMLRCFQDRGRGAEVQLAELSVPSHSLCGGAQVLAGQVIPVTCAGACQCHLETGGSSMLCQAACSPCTAQLLSLQAVLRQCTSSFRPPPSLCALRLPARVMPLRMANLSHLLFLLPFLVLLLLLCPAGCVS